MCKNILLYRSSSREVRIRVPTFLSVVDFSRGILPKKRVKRALLGDLDFLMDLFVSVRREKEACQVWFLVLPEPQSLTKT